MAKAKISVADIGLIEEKIEKLKGEIKAMQLNPIFNKNYKEALKELMYWRRRRIQAGNKK